MPNDKRQHRMADNLMDASISPTASVSNAAARVRRYQDGLGQTFLLIATELPKLFAATKTLVEDDSDNDSSDAELVRQRLKASREVAEAVRVELTSLMCANNKALIASEHLASASQEIASVVKSVGRVGWRLSLTGLNASVMAAHTGNEGVAFSTLTRALTGLADDSAKEARALQAAAIKLAEQGTKQTARQMANAKEHRAALAGAEAHLSVATEGIADSVVAVSSTVNDARTRTKTAIATIARIMEAVQREDILRQKIDHLLFVLDDIGEEYRDGQIASSTVEAAVFLEQSTQLALNLWDEVRVDVNSLVDDIIQSLSDLQPAIELSALTLDAVEAIQSRALTPMRQLEQRLTSLIKAPKPHLAQSAEELESGTERVRDSLNVIQDCTRQLAVLHVLVRIEAARTPEITSAGTIASQIVESTELLGELLDKSFQANSTLYAQLKQMRETAKEIDQRDRTIAELHARTTARIEDLEKAAVTLSEHLGRIRNMGQELRKQAGEFDEKIRMFSDTSGQASNAMDDVQAVHDEALCQIGGEANRATEISPRMLALIDRFTVLSHKTIAAETIHIDLESGDDAGELTLF